MRKIKLFTTTEILLYEGVHPSLAAAIESAVSKGISLDYIDLSFTDLRHITLDGVSIKGGCFREADLTGANLSEAVFEACDFSGALLIDACFCYTDLKDCNFKYARFAATDISMASLDSCAFEGWSCFNIDFSSAHLLTGLTYIHGGTSCPFSSPPCLVIADGHTVAILGKHLINKEIPHTFEHKMPLESMGKLAERALQSLVDTEIKDQKNA